MSEPRTRIGYMTNIYPVTSATFIRREIAALETLDAHVTRFAIRRWGEAFVDPEDQAEQDRTRYLLSGRAGAMLGDLAREIIGNPKGVARALPAWWQMLRRAGGLVRHMAYLAEAASLKRQSVAEDLQHIHAHYSTNTAAVALLAHRMGGPGYSFTTHGPDELVDVGPSALDLKLREARFGVAISHYCKTRLALAGGQEVWDKLHIIRCGLPLEEFTPSHAPIADDAPFICVGRLCPQKAQVLIAQAVAKLAPTRPNLRVIFIGDGEARDAVEAIVAKHDLEGHITLMGWQKNAQVRQQLAQARALLLPSFAEGLPVAIMEAMALGRPVISTYIAGIPELVDQEVGWIIPAGSAEHIAQALEAALDTPSDQLIKMGQVGRERVDSHHNVMCNAKALLSLIRTYSEA